MKFQAAAIQMPSTLGEVDENLERADAYLREARDRGVEVAVLPELFNTGYGLCTHYASMAEDAEGPTLRYLRDRARAWGMLITAGFAERDGRHVHNAQAVCLPNGTVQIYRKRHLVFWERFCFRPGAAPLIVATPWGRVGLAICADMIYRKVWAEYRDRIDLAIISSAWPVFADRDTGRRNWLFGHVGPLSGEIPAKVARDLGIPVIFANQCGVTRTTIPVLGTRIADRFAGLSSLCDGLHAGAVRAGGEAAMLVKELTVHPKRGPVTCHFMSHSVPADSSFNSEPS